MSNQPKIDIQTLSRIFKSTTNSYKYLFFYSILKNIHENSEGTITFKKIAADMLLYSLKLNKYYHLSFGVQDKVNVFIERVAGDQILIRNKYNFGKKEEKYCVQRYSDFGLAELLRYVPYRLVRIFFESELRGLKDSVIKMKIISLVTSHFNDVKPLYRYINSGDQVIAGIEIHQEWNTYLTENYTIVKGWFEKEWALYLQKKNPNTPAIINKIDIEFKRGSLANQTKFWKEYMEKYEVRCIYTGVVLNNVEFQLDHFIPWSFVGHDEYWNLIPASPKANLNKSDILPSNKYITTFIQTQIKALRYCRRNSKNKISSSYMEGLNYDIADMNTAEKKYKELLESQISIAENMGFSANWNCPINL